MFLSSMAIFPPRGMASRALITRLTRICSTCVVSARTGVKSGQTSVDDLNLGTDQPLQHVLHVRHELIESHGLLCDDLPAAERQQLARETRRAIGGLDDFLRVGAALVSLRQVLHEHLRVAVNGHQQVVEIVRDTAGEPANRLHLLGLPQLLLALPKRILRLLALDHVSDHGGKRGAFAHVQRSERKFAGKGSAVLPDDRSLR